MYNEAEHDIYRWNFVFEWPTYTNLNRLVSHIICSLTASIQSIAP